jgi:tRNA wybutosine-synthesizing protein 3
MGTKEYLDAKEKAIASLDKALLQNKVDTDIIPILTLLNDIEGFYTSSSCAGRIVLLQIPTIGDKQQATFLGIWHRTIQKEELTTAAKNATTGLLWILAQAPILHVGVKTQELANQLIKTAVSCGFKNSALKSTGKKTIVELCSTERLDAPIGKDAALFCQDNYLALLVEIANEVMTRSQEKLCRFEKNLKTAVFFD